jgi:hypothetical protein
MPVVIEEHSLVPTPDTDGPLPSGQTSINGRAETESSVEDNESCEYEEEKQVEEENEDEENETQEEDEENETKEENDGSESEEADDGSESEEAGEGSESEEEERVVGNDIGQQIHLLHRILRARKRICLWVVKHLM